MDYIKKSITWKASLLEEKFTLLNYSRNTQDFKFIVIFECELN